MGMFDTITCEMDLPGPGNKNTEFQTKSLRREFGKYTILHSGAVIEVCKECEMNIYIHQHEPIVFYTMITGEWIEYTAELVHSHVKEIKRNIKEEDLNALTELSVWD